MAYSFTHVTDLLFSNKIIEAVIYVYTEHMGAYFWIFLFGLPIIMTYMKTKKFAPTVIVGIVVSPTIIPLFPSFVHYLIFMSVAFGVTGILYKVFHK